MKGCESQATKRPNPTTFPRRRRPPSESLQRLLTDLEKPATASSTGASTPCASTPVSTSCAACWRGPDCPSTPSRGRQLRMLLLAAQPWAARPPSSTRTRPSRWRSGRRDMRIGGTLVRSLHLGKWPRSLAPGFLQGLMAAGAPMDLSVHVGPVPTEQAARTLEWQKVRFESAQSLSFKRGRTMSPEAGDRPGGHHPSQGRGAAGQGAALPRLSLRHPSREGRGVAEGDDPAGEGPLRRHPGQARQPGLPPARGAAVHPAAGPERRRRVADAGHVQHSPSLPLLAARHGHKERHPLRHRPAGLLPGRLRPVGRDPPEREYGGAGPLRLRQVFRHQAGRAQGPDQGHHGLRHRPRGRVRGHGPRRWRQGAFPRRARRGHEPLRHRQGGTRRSFSSASAA